MITRYRRPRPHVQRTVRPFDAPTTCVLCGRTADSAGGWRSIRLEGCGPYYACPHEFPVDATRDERRDAWRRFVEAVDGLTR